MAVIRTEERVERERQHAEILLSDPEAIWGWASPAGRARAERRARLIIEAGGFGPGMKTIEIGCGTGYFTELVSRSGASIVASELSDMLLERAKTRPYASDVTFLCADAGALGAGHKGAYDIVWGNSILHHLDLEVFLPVMRDLLKPGGVLVFAEPNMLNPQIWLERNVPYLRRKSGTSPDETAFIRWTLVRALAAAGFTNATARPHEFLHPATPEPMIPFVRGVSDLAERIWPLREIAGSLLIRAERPIKEDRA